MFFIIDILMLNLFIFRMWLFLFIHVFVLLNHENTFIHDVQLEFRMYHPNLHAGSDINKSVM